MKNKLVLIDFDDTFSLDPELFKKIWLLLEQSGFKVMCCTARSKEDVDNQDIYQHIKKENVLFCEGYQKREFLESEFKITSKDIAFWIDDFPESIVALTFDEVPFKE